MARRPTVEWGAGGMAGDTAASALRLPLAPSVTGNVPRRPLPSPREGERPRTGQTAPAAELENDGGGMRSSRDDGKPTPADSGAQARRGTRRGAPSRPRGTQPAALKTGNGAGGGGPNPGGLPLGMGFGTGPSMRQGMCPYAHSARGHPAAR